MAYCEHCGFRISRGEETCERCGHLDFRYVSDDARPIDPDEIRWADKKGYVVETTCSWSTTKYIVVQDPDDIDNVLAHEPDTEKPAGFFGIIPLLRRRGGK
ncbi:hypothetical protein [Salinibaculum salinum]|uniref:hypothetical protein n=1 Tax=Salinibaculum salinum TaxID=3131996 RepID=UPI0030ED2481